MKQITEKWLREKGACQEGIDWFRECGETQAGKVLVMLVEEEEYSYVGWLLRRLIKTKKQAVEIAVFSARLCLDKFEAKHPKDDRARKAIEAAEAYLKRPCARTKASAYSAVYSAALAASSAARAADSAAYSAFSAVCSAADSASYSAASAVCSAAHSAAESAETKATYLEIIQKAIEVIGL